MTWDAVANAGDKKLKGKKNEESENIVEYMAIPRNEDMIMVPKDQWPTSSVNE